MDPEPGNDTDPSGSGSATLLAKVSINVVLSNDLIVVPKIVAYPVLTQLRRGL
jgi:hypothetical protein